MSEIVKKKYSPRKNKNYINNEDFLNAMIAWKLELTTNPKARLPEYVGHCFMKLTEHLGRKTPMHTQLPDMKSHALITCCLYAKNFNPEKSNNPFAYFTSCINNAFAQIHNKEKAIIDGKFKYIKDKYDISEGYDYSNYLKEDEGEE